MTALAKEFEDSLKNLSNFKPEDLDALIRQAVSTFHMLQEKAESKDPQEIEKALEKAQDLKASLEEQLTQMLQSLGVDPEQLKTFMNEPSNFSPEEQAAMNDVNEQFKRLAPENSVQEQAAPKKRKRPKAWIAG